MSDGANHGITAGRALDTILGGEPPPKKDEGMTPAQMREFLEHGTAKDAYSDASRVTGAIILAFLDAHPNLRHLQADDVYHFPKDSKGEYEITALGLIGAMELAGVKIDDGLTGFMYGWAVNAAKYALGAPPVANPALLTVEFDGSAEGRS
jgi:hypothetical protein